MIATLYFIGVIVSLIIIIFIAKKLRDFITIGDLVFILFAAACSWVGVIAEAIAICILLVNWDKVIWRKKE